MSKHKELKVVNKFIKSLYYKIQNIDDVKADDTDKINNLVNNQKKDVDTSRMDDRLLHITPPQCIKVM